jgi:hypothetical protein
MDEVQLSLDGAFHTLFLIAAMLGSLLLATGAVVRFAQSRSRATDPVR